MRKSISSAIIYSLPIVLFTFLNIVFSGKINNDYIYPVIYQNKIYNLEQQTEFDFIIVGHSHSLDAFPMNEEDEIGFINLSLSAQNLYWSNEILKKYEEFFSDKPTVIIELSLTTFCMGEQKGTNRYLPLGFHYIELGLNYSDFLLERYLPLFGNFRVLLAYNSLVSNKQNVIETENEMILNRKEYYKNVVSSPDCEKINIERNIQNLENIILHHKKRNTTVIFFSSPLYLDEELNQSNYRVRLLNEIVLELTKKHNIEYFDDSFLYEISNDWQNFRDSNHLSQTGANKYKEFFFDRLSNQN